MAKTHTVSQTYSGGGTSPISVNNSFTGQAELDYNEASCTSATTTLAPSFVMNPATQLQCAVFSATGGNATVSFVPITGTATTIALTSGVPVVVQSVGGTCPQVPSGSETYTLKVLNPAAGTATVAFEARMLRS